MRMAQHVAAWAKSGYTAADYVGASDVIAGRQSPLVLMWDAIENDGRGKHKTIVEGISSTQWNEWVEEIRHSQTSYRMFSTNDQIGVTASTSVTIYNFERFSDLFKTGVFTFELCGRMCRSSSVTNPSIIRSGTQIRLDGNRTRLDCIVNGITLYNPLIESLPSINESQNAVLYSSCGNGTSITTSIQTSSGDVERTGTSGTFTAASSLGVLFNSNAGEDGRVIHCMRFYNRPLTKDEIELNRKIDIERFGLPTA